MMDLKEIIRWFIPCFHIRPAKKRKTDAVLAVVYMLFLFINSCVVGMAAREKSLVESENHLNSTKNLVFSLSNAEEYSGISKSEDRESRSMEDTSVGRTFGRPFKKMIGALMPLIFQVGAASTWAVVAALVGVKTLVVTLVILKILLIAGAAKIGALFGSKGQHQSQHWEPPPHHQKEIHLHIHNGGHEHEHHVENAPYSSWSREGTSASPDLKNINIVYDPYRGGPQTISTPFGNYVKIDPLSPHK